MDGVPVNEVAAEFGVTPKVIRDDLRLLMYTGTGEYAGELIDFDLTALERRRRRAHPRRRVHDPPAAHQRAARASP